MTMPTIEKTWQYKPNIIKPALTAGHILDYKTHMMNIKKALTTFATNPWVVTGSSDGSTAGMDGVDRWDPTIIGTDTNASVNTSSNNTLRIRTIYSTFMVFTVTAGASTAKTTIASDLNTAFAAAGQTLYATVDGSNRLVISDTSNNSFIETDSVANGSTLSTAVGFTTGGMNSVSKLLYAAAGSAHSWITLKQTGVHANFEICLDWSAASIYNATVVVGFSGFSGGSTTARPTATNQIILINGSTWAGYTINGSFGCVLQAMQSTDGQCTRIVQLLNGVPQSFFLFDVPKNPVSGWTDPAIALAVSANSAVTYLGYFNDTARVVGWVNGVACYMYITCEGAISSTLPEQYAFQQRNQITLEQQVWPMGLASDTTGARGRHGQPYDLWWGNIIPNNLGSYCDTTYPDDSTRRYWQSADIILPWDGTALIPGSVVQIRS